MQPLTLVLSCATPDHVIQVSDRRVTYSDGRIVDDARNKGTSFQGRFVVGYSGLAQIGDLPTDAWISVALASAEKRHPFHFLAQAAANDIGHLRHPAVHKRIAIIAVGWVHDAKRGLFPAQFIVSNALKEDWSWHAEAQDEFVCRDHVLYKPTETKMRWALCGPIGAPPTPQIWGDLCRGFARARKRRRGPTEVAKLLAQAIREVAKQNAGVGNNLVVLISPRPSSNSEVRMGTTIAESGAAAPHLSDTACYLLAEGSFEFEWTMPNFVMDGWAFTDCTVGRKDTQLAMFTRVRRRGTGGPAGIALQGANGAEIRLEAVKGQPLQTRIIQTGQPDKISTGEKRTDAILPDILTNRPERR